MKETIKRIKASPLTTSINYKKKRRKKVNTFHCRLSETSLIFTFCQKVSIISYILHISFYENNKSRLPHSFLTYITFLSFQEDLWSFLLHAWTAPLIRKSCWPVPTPLSRCRRSLTPLSLQSYVCLKVQRTPKKRSVTKNENNCSKKYFKVCHQQGRALHTPCNDRHTVLMAGNVTGNDQHKQLPSQCIVTSRRICGTQF